MMQGCRERHAPVTVTGGPLYQSGTFRKEGTRLVLRARRAEVTAAPANIGETAVAWAGDSAYSMGMPVSYYYLEPPAAARPMTQQDELLHVVIGLNAGRTAEQLIDMLFDTLGSLIPLDRISLAMLGPDDVLEARRTRSRYPIFWGEGARAPIAGTSLEPIIREHKIRIIDDLAAYMAEHPASRTTPLLLREGMRSSLTLPLIVRDRPIGLLFLTSTRPRSYRKEHVEFSRGIAHALAVAIERSSIMEELRRANEDLRALDQLKNNFLSNLSHELRTPLSEVLSYAFALEDEVAGSLAPEQHRYLQTIITGAERLEELLSDLFDYTALEAGVFPLERVPVDLEALACEVVEEARPALEAEGLRLALDRAQVPLIVEGDPPRLAQIVRALVSNACKFTPGTGTVTVRVGAEADQAWIEVQDTGIGIAAGDQPKVFQKFTQLDSGSGRRYRGAGLGLALSKALAEAHGGTLTLKSEVGKGSVFRLSLPRA